MTKEETIEIYEYTKEKEMLCVSIVLSHEDCENIKKSLGFASWKLNKEIKKLCSLIGKEVGFKK